MSKAHTPHYQMWKIRKWTETLRDLDTEVIFEG